MSNYRIYFVLIIFGSSFANWRIPRNDKGKRGKHRFGDCRMIQCSLFKTQNVRFEQPLLLHLTVLYTCILLITTTLISWRPRTPAIDVTRCHICADVTSKVSPLSAKKSMSRRVLGKTSSGTGTMIASFHGFLHAAMSLRRAS